MNTYAIEKLRLEQQILSLDIPTITIIRPRAIYGENDRVLLYSLLRASLAKRILYFGTRDVKTSLTSVHSLCDFCVFIHQKQPHSKEIYNLSDKKVYSLLNVVSAINHTFYKKQPLLLSFRILSFLNTCKVINKDAYL